MYQEVKLKVTLENISKLKKSPKCTRYINNLVTIKQDKPVFHCMT